MRDARDPETAGGGAVADPTPPPPAAPTGEAPPDTTNPDGGAPSAEPPPAEPPPSFPVPPVPPPPVDVNLGGTGQGGAASYARVGSEAAAPYRTPFFATNRVQSGGQPSIPAPRFGPGVPTTPATAAPSPFFDAGGGQPEQPTPTTDDDLARIVAAIAGRRQGR